MSGRSVVRLLDVAVAGLVVLALMLLALFAWAARVADNHAVQIESRIIAREFEHAVAAFREDLPRQLSEAGAWVHARPQMRAILPASGDFAPGDAGTRVAALLGAPGVSARLDALARMLRKAGAERERVEFAVLGHRGDETLAVAALTRDDGGQGLALEVLDLSRISAALDTLQIELRPLAGPDAAIGDSNGRLDIAGLDGGVIGVLNWRGKRLAAIATRQVLPGLLAIVFASTAILLIMRRHWQDARHAFEQDLHRVERMASTDTLTSLPNRRALFRHLAEVAPAAQNFAPVTLLMIDLDGFKWVNDTLGHEAGDRLLALAAEVLREEMGKGTFLARLGGDEFVAVIPGDITGGALERLHAHLTETMLRRAGPMRADQVLGLSIGAVASSAHGGGGDHMLKLADIAVYAAKAAGRGRAVTYDRSLESDKAFRRTLERDLRAAVLSGDLCVHHQPIVTAFDGKVIGYESLVRWRHPYRGLLGPADFIPLAEDSDLIARIGDKVLDLALAELGPADGCRISVNTTARQLMSEGFEARVLALLARHGVAAERLCLELTETSLVTDGERVGQVMQGLRAHGVKFAIDDFGTGYSSLSYLMRFTFDMLKLDRDFIAALDDKPESPTIVTAITALARSLGMDIVGEGVETAEQQRFLAAAGCTFLQGYLFGRPAPLPDLGLAHSALAPANQDVTLHQQRAA